MQATPQQHHRMLMDFSQGGWSETIYIYMHTYVCFIDQDHCLCPFIFARETYSSLLQTLLYNQGL